MPESFHIKFIGKYFLSPSVSTVFRSLPKADISKLMDDKEAKDEPSWKKQHEYASTVEEKVSIIFLLFFLMPHGFHNSIGSNIKVIPLDCALGRSYFLTTAVAPHVSQFQNSYSP